MNKKQINYSYIKLHNLKFTIYGINYKFYNIAFSYSLKKKKRKKRNFFSYFVNVSMLFLVLNLNIFFPMNKKQKIILFVTFVDFNFHLSDIRTHRNKEKKMKRKIFFN